jgi:TonB family protein
MIGQGFNHLWQSTVFAAVAWLLTIAFRQNRAHVRHWIWFSASVKFFVPFALLVNFGGHLPCAPAAQRIAQHGIAVTMVQISQPFPGRWPSGLWSALSTQGLHNWFGLIILGVWACGFGAIALIRLQTWRCIRAAVHASTPLEIRGAENSAVVQVGSAPGLLEPGVVGWLRPILLLPAGIEEHLTPPQLKAVLTHELCHVWRRDNFTAAIHMVSEAVFWFHPLVWWIGARLVDERECACDEEVIRLGSNPRVYAEGILKTCEFCVESPLACVTGVTGADLGKRIEAIMRNQARETVTRWKKVLLGAAIVLAFSVPVVVGVLNAARLQAQSPPIAPSSSPLEIASAKPDEPVEGPTTRPIQPSRRFASTRSTGGGTGSGLQIDALNFCCPDYLVHMIDRIGTNWVEQADVAGTNVVMFTIQRDGRIVDVVLEQSSGFQELDLSSQRALLETKKLNPLPAAFRNPTLTVHLKFQYRR